MLHQRSFRHVCKTSHFGIYESVTIISKIKRYISITICVQTCSEKMERKMAALAKLLSYAFFHEKRNRVGKSDNFYSSSTSFCQLFPNEYCILLAPPFSQVTWFSTRGQTTQNAPSGRSASGICDTKRYACNGSHGTGRHFVTKSSLGDVVGS